MENTIGLSIGVVDHAFSITNDAGDKVTLSVKVDFRSASNQDIKGWLISNRIIAGQRPWRTLSKGELTELNNKTFVASSIGQKVRSREEQKRDLVTTFVNAGVKPDKAEELATAALDNPDSLSITS